MSAVSKGQQEVAISNEEEEEKVMAEPVRLDLLSADCAWLAKRSIADLGLEPAVEDVWQRKSSAGTKRSSAEPPRCSRGRRPSPG